jgi:hypothetical protein
MAEEVIHYDITCYQGATLLIPMTWSANGSAVDLRTYSAKLQVRKTHNSPITVLECSTGADARIALGGMAGTITITVASTDTANLVPGELCVLRTCSFAL